ncbi:MAG TPA: co-chaperone GroES, partial [Flavitalea sp.]|nr:co-chaperone GroES [Flavitalea sp.]
SLYYIIITKLKNAKLMATNVKVTPLHDRVIVKPAKAEEKTAGGIIIPDTAKEKPQRGTVVAAGPGKKDEPTTVKIGDTVLYGKYSGTEISLEGDELLIMRESDILAIL